MRAAENGHNPSGSSSDRRIPHNWRNQGSLLAGVDCVRADRKLHRFLPHDL